LKNKMYFATSVVLFVIIVLIASGCGNQGNKVIFSSDMVKYDMQGGADFGFNVNVIMQDKGAKIEFVNFFGENTEGLAVEMVDDSFEELKNLKYNGYYIRLLGFGCHTSNEYVQIDGMNLKVSGADMKIEFDTPIRHSVANYDDAKYEYGGLYFTGRPSIVSTMSYPSTEYSYDFSTEQDVIIEDFSFNNFLALDDAVVFVNMREIGMLKDLLPLEVKSGSSISIRGYFSFNGEGFSEYDSIYCISKLSYKSFDKANSYEIPGRLVSQSVSNTDDAKRVIEILGK